MDCETCETRGSAGGVCRGGKATQGFCYFDIFGMVVSEQVGYKLAINIF